MEICVDKKEDDFSNIKGGDIFKDVAYNKYYIVADVYDLGQFLVGLETGCRYSKNGLFGEDKEDFIKVSGCFKASE